VVNVDGILRRPPRGKGRHDRVAVGRCRAEHDERVDVGRTVPEGTQAVTVEAKSGAKLNHSSQGKEEDEEIGLAEGFLNPVMDRGNEVRPHIKYHNRKCKTGRNDKGPEEGSVRALFLRLVELSVRISRKAPFVPGVVN